MTPSRLWLYRYEWSTLNAAGEGRLRGSTGAWTVLAEAPDDGGNLGSAEHCDAIIMLCTGNSMACSLAEDFEDATARTWVGYVGCADEADARMGIERFEGTCDLGIELGRCDEDRLEIPASILDEIEFLVNIERNGVVGHNVLVSLSTETSANILCRYIGQLWGYSHDCVA